jgi:hypothetical protein
MTLFYPLLLYTPARALLYAPRENSYSPLKLDRTKLRSRLSTEFTILINKSIGPPYPMGYIKLSCPPTVFAFTSAGKPQ